MNVLDLVAKYAEHGVGAESVIFAYSHVFGSIGRAILASDGTGSAVQSIAAATTRIIIELSLAMDELEAVKAELASVNAKYDEAQDAFGKLEADFIDQSYEVEALENENARTVDVLEKALGELGYGLYPVAPAPEADANAPLADDEAASFAEFMAALEELIEWAESQEDDGK